MKVSTKHGEDTVIILESGGRKVNSMRNNDVCSNISFHTLQTYYTYSTHKVTHESNPMHPQGIVCSVV